MKDQHDNMKSIHQNCILEQKIKNRIKQLQLEDKEDFKMVEELGKKLNWTDEDIKGNHECENWRHDLIKELESFLE